MAFQRRYAPLNLYSAGVPTWSEMQVILLLFQRTLKPYYREDKIYDGFKISNAKANC